MAKLVIQLFFVYMLLSKYSIDFIVWKYGYFASLATLVGQERCYVSLIYSQEKHLHSKEKSKEKSRKILGRMDMNHV